MAFRIFTDANVLLDFTLKRNNYDLSKRLLNKAESGDVRAFISPSVLHITAHWLSKAYGSKNAKVILQELLAFITVIDASHEIVLLAIHSKMNDIEDALQYYTALHHKIDAFVSSDANLKKSAISSLPVYTLKEFIQLNAENK